MRNRRFRDEWEACFIENNMARSDDLPCLSIQTTVSAMIRRISKKNTWRRPRAQLVCRGGCLVRVVQAAKDAQLIVIRWRAKKKFMWCRAATGLAGPAIDEKCGGGKSFDPEFAGHAGMEEKTADTVI
jgi:hypothetical protein